MMEKSIVYFDKPGKKNTDELVNLVKQRAEELGISTLVVASTSGETAIKLDNALEDVTIVSITHHAGFKEKGVLELTEEAEEELVKRGILAYTGSHALSGVGRGLTNKYGGFSPLDIMADTLRMFSHGVKVCVECSIMAADAGLIPMDEEIICVGGRGSGADTAVVLSPAHMTAVFDINIHEIIAMPRE